jgi:sugar lactone lactonase YvrE
MSSRRSAHIILVLVFLCFFLTNASFAHPASGIVVDDQGHVYFIYSSHGVMRIEPSGKLTNIHEDRGGHWLALDTGGAFSKVKPKQFERITPDGSIPSLIFASGGAPIVVGPEGNLYYGSNGSQEESFPPGAMTVVRLSPDGRIDLFAPVLKQRLAELKDGITGLASSSDGSIYVATWNGIVKLTGDGSIAKIMHPVVVKDCDRDPADHNPANASSPLLRGLDVDSGGNVYVAATSCHRALQITPDGQVTSILRSERPWSPTGIAVSGKDIYVLEYTNANGPATEGWYPRVRKRAMDGVWRTLVTVPPEISSAHYVNSGAIPLNSLRPKHDQTFTDSARPGDIDRLVSSFRRVRCLSESRKGIRHRPRKYAQHEAHTPFMAECGRYKNRGTAKADEARGHSNHHEHLR